MRAGLARLVGWARQAWRGIAIGAVVLALAGCGASGAGKRHLSPHVVVHKPGGDWPAPNGDVRNTRWVGGPIDAATVSRLHPAWSIPSTPITGTTVILHGVAYLQDANCTVWAISAARGRVRWRHRFGVPFNGPNGVAVGDGRVYASDESNAFALDAKTGRLLWSTRLVRNAHEGIDMAPAYRHGTLYISTVPTNSRGSHGGGARGVVWAIDGKSGHKRWTWASVPPDLWGHPGINSGGGLWEPPALDDAGNVYVAVGNPGPWTGVPGYPWATSRPGPNRWTNSIAKLDARSGRMLWARQVVPHDLYDWDLQGPPILTRVRGRLVALVGGKMGFVFAFDAATGGLLWKRSVGEHNGHDDDSLKAMHGSEDVGGKKVLPGQLGGVETQMAIDRDTVYVPVVNLFSAITNGFIPGQSGPLEDGKGELVALDIATGEVRWDHKLPQGPYGGATVVNDLVFATTYEGTLWALRTDTGDVAWSAKLPAGSNAPIAVARDLVIAPATVPQATGQPMKIAAYRLTAG